MKGGLEAHAEALDVGLPRRKAESREATPLALQQLLLVCALASQHLACHVGCRSREMNSISTVGARCSKNLRKASSS